MGRQVSRQFQKGSLRESQGVETRLELFWEDPSFWLGQLAGGREGSPAQDPVAEASERVPSRLYVCHPSEVSHGEWRVTPEKTTLCPSLHLLESRSWHT